MKFRKEESRLVLIYSGEQQGTHWVYHQFEKCGSIILNRTFTLQPKNLVEDYPQKLDSDMEFEEIEFFIARTTGEYFQLQKDILGIKNNIFVHKDFPLTRRTFVAEHNISIFSKIDVLSAEDIYIGGNEQDSIPVAEFQALLNSFPNSYELRRYAEARIGAILDNYINLVENSQQRFISYMNRKISKIGTNLHQELAELEVFKYTEILENLEFMLADENSYSEKQWQDEILRVILLLYPKYIHAFKEAPVRDVYSNKNRRIDFLLVDSTGNTDIIEIKKPFDQCIVTQKTYRDNYIPLRDLSGTVMQVEKYIFCLNKWGRKGEETLTKRYEDHLTPGLVIKVTNPSGIIIMGRDVGLTPEQKQDFEVIKRKYKNVIDIVTYDDLLSRLKIMLLHWQSCV